MWPFSRRLFRRSEMKESMNLELTPPTLLKIGSKDLSKLALWIVWTCMIKVNYPRLILLASLKQRSSGSLLIFWIKGGFCVVAWVALNCSQCTLHSDDSLNKGQGVVSKHLSLNVLKSCMLEYYMVYQVVLQLTRASIRPYKIGTIVQNEVVISRWNISAYKTSKRSWWKWLKMLSEIYLTRHLNDPENWWKSVKQNDRFFKVLIDEQGVGCWERERHDNGRSLSSFNSVLCPKRTQREL